MDSPFANDSSTLLRLTHGVSMECLLLGLTGIIGQNGHLCKPTGDDRHCVAILIYQPSQPNFAVVIHYVIVS